jgi:hypothetical protein
MSEQVFTVGATITEIMSTEEFARGFEDARAGKPFDWAVGLKHGSQTNGAWDYERGRLFAHIAPLTMPLRIKGKLNPVAVALCGAAFDRKLII